MRAKINCIKHGCLNMLNGGMPCNELEHIKCSSKLRIANCNTSEAIKDLINRSDDMLLLQEKCRILAGRLHEKGVSEDIILRAIVYALESLYEDFTE